MIENLRLIQGEKLILKCLINSNPLCYQIRWLFNNQELRTQSCTIRNQSEFIIDHIDRLQAGKYTCEVKNRFNSSIGNQSEGISHISTNVRVQCKSFKLKDRLFNEYL
jgi:hypothetical protein